MRNAIRKALSALLGRQRWLFLVWYRERFGLLRAIASGARLPFGGGFGSAPGYVGHPTVRIRPGTADQHVYDQVFVNGDYALELGRPQVLIDAGAHIGLASVYFASRYPGVRIIAIEPEPSNYALLLRNVRRLPNVACINAGLWSRRAQLEIVDDSADTWGFQVREAVAGRGIPAVCLAELIRDHRLERIDLLKIDIEGSEIEVLSTASEWLERVDTLLIELHDRFRPGCTQALEAALAGFDYKSQTAGDSLVISGLRKRTPTRASVRSASI